LRGCVWTLELIFSKKKSLFWILWYFFKKRTLKNKNLILNELCFCFFKNIFCVKNLRTSIKEKRKKLQRIIYRVNDTSKLKLKRTLKNKKFLKWIVLLFF
jgi:hypothetical protein